jgi:tetratricopeptide (TPR) repeat protein
MRSRRCCVLFPLPGRRLEQPSAKQEPPRAEPPPQRRNDAFPFAGELAQLDALGERLAGCIVEALSPRRLPAGYSPSGQSLHSFGDEPREPEPALLAEELRKEGLRLVHAGQANAALLVFAEALRLLPDNPQLLLCRSACHSRLGRNGDALEDSERAAALAPHLSRAWWQAGLSLEAQGRSLEALESYDRAAACAEAEGQMDRQREYAARGAALRRALEVKASAAERVRRVEEEEEILQRR